MLNETNPSTGLEQVDTLETFTPNWASHAPRGGRAVLSRILKESATVPLFLAQTFVQSLRDVGYNTTTSALEEHVDNAIEAGATEIRAFFRQTGSRGSFQTDIMVCDNGRGMAPNVLKVATSFGGSLSYGNRSGIGRFGMGMKTAALSMSPVMELYSWQEPRAVYNMILDTNAIGRDRANVIELPDPKFSENFPPEIAQFFTWPLSFPKDKSEQHIVAPDGVDLWERLGPHGTVVYMPECDRISYATDRKLVDHATKEMARVYRRALASGLKLYINNRRVEAFDPTYAMATARHARVEGLKVKVSRLLVKKEVEINLNDDRSETAKAIVKIYALPIEDWSTLPRKVQKNDLHLFEGFNVSILRNDREVFAGSMPEIGVPRHSVANWFRIEIDFRGVLDEAFGIAANKQGVRLKGYAIDAINKAVGDEISTLTEEIKRFQSMRAAERKGSAQSASEARANEADAFLSEPLEVAVTPEEEAQIEANLRGLAVGLLRNGESEEEAYERVKNSRYIITYTSDPYWPFYHVEHKFGRIILTINTAHPFFSQLYDPLLKSGVREAVENEEANEPAADAPRGPVDALELMLLSLARAQSVLSRENEEAAKIFEAFRRTWSETYRVQLTA
jgi:Histidine kinase-, DNA gyrase B-, and HSP90-like ATPase